MKVSLRKNKNEPRQNKYKYLNFILVLIISIFGFLWAVFSSAGHRGSIATMIVLFLVTTQLVSLIDIVLSRLKIKNILMEMKKLEKYISEELSKSSCFVMENCDKCPLGIVRIEENTESTIRESISSTKREFSWFGLSAFNVIHRNADLFRSMINKRVVFYLIHSDMGHELDLHDTKRPKGPTFIHSKQLLELGVEQANDLKQEVRDSVNMELWRYKKVPEFRIIQVDNQIAYISFYEYNEDALKSHQLIVENDPDNRYNLYKWFDQYVSRAREHYASKEF